MDTSSADTHSSQIMTSGESSNARAMAMRWHCPPLSSEGYLPRVESGSPTRLSISRTVSRALCGLKPSTRIFIGSTRILSTV